MKFKELREKIEPVNIGKEITPPAMLVLKRRGIRVFPSGQRVALYSNDHYGLMFTVPYGASGLGMSAQSPLMGVKEEVEQVNELSRDLLKRYSKAAKLDADKIFDKPKYQTKYATGTHIDPKSGYSERNLADRVPLSKKDDIRTDKREVGQEIAKHKLSRVSQQVKVKADNQPTLSAKRQSSFKFEEVEQVDEFHSVLGGLGDAIARKVSAKTYRALKRRHFKKPASGASPAAPKGKRSP